ncbi:hypothetical protein AVEN_9293-1 [Araneus ventricosus]|uniref:Uncharacterized protein n=1 Tax=Araneus ventricosus TaxID=182803 RepID=A0A4Y2KW90_ARAVE|nr:hypothetical protein AVEN_9293-1 [Araneus ventricosus]
MLLRGTKGFFVLFVILLTTDSVDFYSICNALREPFSADFFIPTRRTRINYSLKWLAEDWEAISIPGPLSFEICDTSPDPFVEKNSENPRQAILNEEYSHHR